MATPKKTTRKAAPKRAKTASAPKRKAALAAASRLIDGRIAELGDYEAVAGARTRKKV